MQEFEPFAILASLVSVFIVFLINRWLGGYAPAHLDSDEDALDRLRLDFPAFDQKATLVGADGKSAVLAGDDGSVALVEAVGDKFLTRMLQPGDISALTLEPGSGPRDNGDGPRLRLRLNDFTNAAFDLTMAAGTNGSTWHKRLSKFHNAPENAPEGDDGSVALVEAVGDKFLTRMLQPGDISALALEPASPGGDADGPRLRLRLNDFTNAAFDLTMAAGTNGSTWHKRLSKFHNMPENAPENAPEGDARG